MAPASAGEFDFTFTDKELEDVLGMVERQQYKGVFDPSAIPFLSGTDGDTPLALQFQVRFRGGGSGHGGGRAQPALHWNGCGGERERRAPMPELAGLCVSLSTAA